MPPHAINIGNNTNKTAPFVMKQINTGHAAEILMRITRKNTISTTYIKKGNRYLLKSRFFPVLLITIPATIKVIN